MNVRITSVVSGDRALVLRLATGLARDGRCKQRKINMSMQVCPELISEDWAGGGRGHQPLPLGDGRKN